MRDKIESIALQYNLTDAEASQLTDELFDLYSVSQQRELLEAFRDKLNQSRLLNCRVYKDEIDLFLASYCG